MKHDRTTVVPAPGVLGNDLNVSLLGGTSAILVSGVSHGDLNLRSNGGYIYTPDAGYVGSDTFRYRPSGLLSTAATVTITITNAAPVARPDAYAGPNRTTLVVGAPGVLGNDTDGDADALTAELDGGGISGSLALDPDGGFRYSPGGGFSGMATFDYRVWDGIAWSATTTVTLTIAAATPTPTPTPAPGPTATPRPTPRPTASSSSSTPDPTATSTASPGATASPDNASGPSGTPRDATGSPSASPDASEAVARRPSASASGGSQPAGRQGVPRRPSDAESGVEELSAASISIDLLAPSRPSDAKPIRLSLGPLGLLGGIDVWAIPGLVIGVPGLLVIIFVLLQGAGAMAWIPAIRRLRGDEQLA